MNSDAHTLSHRAARVAAVLGFLASLILSMHAVAKPAAALATADAADDVWAAPVIVDGEELFRVRGTSAYPAEMRADRIAERIRAIARDRSVPAGTVAIMEAAEGSRIAAGERHILTVVDADAQLEELDRKVLALVYASRIGEAIEGYRRNREATDLVRNGLLAVAATAVLAAFLWLGGLAMRRLDELLERRLKGMLEDVEAQSLRIVSAASMWRVLRAIRSLIWSGSAVIAVVLYLNFVLQLFPWTRWLGRHLLALLMVPLRAAGEGLLTLIPDLIVLTILVLVMRYVLKTIRLLFDGIETGAVTVAGFDREWASPTYRLVRLFAVMLALVVAYPYIPGSDSDAFKGLTVFLGVVFSLGSSSLIGNIIAGYSMTYRRAFHVGDLVRIGNHVGDIVSTRLLVTNLRTPKNEEIIIPNSEILSSSVVNYTTFAREGKLIVHTTVGIGYETPWRQVQAMLLEAARRTEGLLMVPEPFVFQKALGDFAVTYQINAYCNDAQAMNQLYSRLHANILDVFNEFGVQIMTPAYEGDPAQAKVVPKDQWYAAPAAPAATRP